MKWFSPKAVTSMREKAGMSKSQVWRAMLNIMFQNPDRYSEESGEVKVSPSLQMVTKIEAGESTNPSTYVELLAGAMNCDPGDFFVEASR